MLKKEFQEVTKQLLYYLIVLAVVPAFIKLVGGDNVGSYFETLFIMVNFSVLFFSGWMGVNLFLFDKKSGAGDYVLALPYSRLRLLVVKVVPRLAALAVVYIGYFLLYMSGGQEIVVKSAFILFSCFFWVLFFAGMSFSASFDGYLKVIGTALAAVLGFIGLFILVANAAVILKGGDPQFFGMQSLFDLAGGLNAALPLLLIVSVILLLPYVISFVLAYKKWGLLAKEKYNNRFITLLLPLLAVGFIVSGVIASSLIPNPGYSKYLTAGHSIIESDVFSTRVTDLDGNQLAKITPGRFYVFFEKDKYAYGIARGGESIQLIRIDTGTGAHDVLREKSYSGYESQWRNIRLFNNTITLSENYYARNQHRFILIDALSGKTRVLKADGILPRRYYHPVIFGAGQGTHNNHKKSFWLISSERYEKYPILKMWENGGVENLGYTITRPHYLNGILITGTKEAMVFRRFTESGLEVIKEIPEYKDIDFLRYGRWPAINTHHEKEIYGTSWKNEKYRRMRLDLETLEIFPINRPDNEKYFLSAIAPGQYYRIEHSGRYKKNQGNKGFHLEKISRVQKGNFNLVKEFPKPGTTTDSDYFWINKNGIIIRKNDKISILTLPDLKKIK